MLLEVKDLEILYGKNTPVVQNVNFNLQPGEILAIVGESGSGKTSVIRAIQNCLPPSGKVSQGEIFFKEKNLFTLSNKEKRDLCGTAISMIFQDSGNMLNPIKTIGEQFQAYLMTHGFNSKKEALDKAIEMITMVRLANPENILNSYVFELSGGMRQRVGIAMAMSFNPCLLLADEPTSALDVTMQAQIIKEMMNVRDKLNVAIIIVTHNLGVASYMADKILIMKNGLVLEQGATKDVISNPKDDYTKTLLDAVPRLGGR